MRTALGPVAFQYFQLDCGRLGGEHPLRSELRCRAVERAFDIENIPFANEQTKLLTLDSANFGLIGADREYRSGIALTNLGDIFGIAVDDAPTYTGADCRFCNLRHSGPYRFDQNSAGPLRGILNQLDELLSLIHRIVVGIDDLDLDAKPVLPGNRSLG